MLNYQLLSHIAPYKQVQSQSLRIISAHPSFAGFVMMTAFSSLNNVCWGLCASRDCLQQRNLIGQPQLHQPHLQRLHLVSHSLSTLPPGASSQHPFHHGVYLSESPTAIAPTVTAAWNFDPQPPLRDGWSTNRITHRP